MKPIQEIKKEVDKEYKLGAFQCVGTIIKLMEREQMERDTPVEGTMKFSNDNIQNLDMYFKEIVTILIRKGYKIKLKPKQHIEVYFNVGYKGTETYFKNIDESMNTLTNEEIKTFGQFSKITFHSDDEIVKSMLNDIEESIRRTIVSNKERDKDVTEVSVNYDIPNEGNEPLEYYCKNDEVLYRIVDVLEKNGCICETGMKLGRFPRMKDGYYYRELNVKWEK